MSAGAWRRVTRSAPCPVCGRPDWCMLAPDGGAAICARVESDRRAGDAGYLHRLRDGRGGRREYVRRIPARVPGPTVAIDFGALAARYTAALSADRLADLAGSLGVSAAALSRLRAGWDGSAYTFPMRDASGRVVGVRRRFPDGRKLSVKGGHEGLFIPRDLAGDGLLCIAEGPTDTASLLTLGVETIGRPSCRGAVHHACDVASRRDAVVIADGDKPGREGAIRLCGALRIRARSVRLIAPPAGVKDARAWVEAGATRDDVLAAIESAAPIRRWSDAAVAALLKGGAR